MEEAYGFSYVLITCMLLVVSWVFVTLFRTKKTRVTAINVFPVKSIRGFSVKEWPLDEYGLAKDRNWMVVRANNFKFITQREMPKMALISASLSADLKVLTLSAPGCKDLQVSEGSEKCAAEIWRSTFDAIDTGDEAAEWLTQYLGTEARLVRIPPNHKRDAPSDFVSPFADLDPKPCINTSFADGFPLLLGCESSLKDLNARIRQTKQNPIEMVRFRPNIVVDGQRPYEEDEWHTFKIGDLVFYNVKPCTRCTIPNVNPREGKKDTNVRGVLESYRYSSEMDNPLFAINLAHTVTAVGKKIRVGDVVNVEKWKSPPNVTCKKNQEQEN